MKRAATIVVMLTLLAAAPRPAGAQRPPAPSGEARPPVAVGSKQFTESVILGEIVVRALEAAGEPAVHRRELGGTRIVYEALRRGEIDVYPEYLGTLRQEIFAGRDAATDDDLRSLLAADGVAMTASLGFSNSYGLAVARETAARLELAKISDLVRHPDLRLGLSNEFMDRGDGWRNLRRHYALPQDANGMVHEVAYQQLQSGVIDVTDVYTTDAAIERLDLVVLEDDLHYFPPYDAVLLYRAELAEKRPAAVAALEGLQSKISESDMIALNAMVESRRASEARAAAGFMERTMRGGFYFDDDTAVERVGRRTLEHLSLVLQSLVPAILVAIPLGVLSGKAPRVGRVVLGGAGIVQTIPALALLVLLIAPVAALGFGTLGAGSATAIAALFLYSLLPIVQNTATGLTTIPPEYGESATALGLSRWFRLTRIELPLASPSILAGVKTAAVLNVGFATLGALVGAGGYGQPIMSGIRLNRTSLILEGAVPAACLAILLQLGFEIAERWLLPAGLRVRPAEANE
jgi:osmoprotectant transport system permease protein